MWLNTFKAQISKQLRALHIFSKNRHRFADRTILNSSPQFRTMPAAPAAPMLPRTVRNLTPKPLPSPRRRPKKRTSIPKPRRSLKLYQSRIKARTRATTAISTSTKSRARFPVSAFRVAVSVWSVTQHTLCSSQGTISDSLSVSHDSNANTPCI